jgi:50S ribosomal subunit-associated GTPase HflX
MTTLRRTARIAGCVPAPRPRFRSRPEKDFRATMARVATLVTGLGGRVVGEFVQRRGVSDGGVTWMSQPFSRRTLLRAGKVQEVAEACRSSGAGTVVFANALNQHQREALEAAFGCPVVSAVDLAAAQS